MKKIQIRTSQTTEIIRPDSSVATLLKVADEEGAEEFLTSAYSRLKAVAEGNAKRMYEIDYFIDAVKEVRTEVEKNQANTAAANGPEDNTEAPNYERSMQDAYEKAKQKGENDPNRVPTNEHEMTNQVREILGEKIHKKARASRGGNDSDDELEVVRGNVEDEHALKCPVTGMLFKDPVKNKVCGHTYDRAGLMQLLGMRKTTCPIPGCSNKSLSISQVEVDEEMVLRVRRHLKREEAEKRKRDLEDDDDDEEGGNYTVLE